MTYIFQSIPTLRSFKVCCIVGSLGLLLSGCSTLPSSGPSEKELVQRSQQVSDMGIQLIEINDSVAQRLTQRQQGKRFSDALGSANPQLALGAGDFVEVHVWEAPPATLFGGGAIDPRSTSSARSTVLPEQMVDREGFISVPFAGRIKAAGLTPRAIESDIASKLRGKANTPEVLVRLTRGLSSSVTVVGDVQASLRMPLTAGKERLLDALAAAGGVRQPVSKITVQVTRGNGYYSMPLDTVIRDPNQNVPLAPGDVVTAMFQPLSFTALGATGKNEEIPFEAQGISLAQALARAGGLNDSRSDAKGVFIFRMEPSDALDWPSQPVRVGTNGLVPVVYRVNLKDPRSFFAMQTFTLADKDVLYVSNAPAAELQKFLNLLLSVGYPVLTAIQVAK